MRFLNNDPFSEFMLKCVNFRLVGFVSTISALVFLSFCGYSSADSPTHQPDISSLSKKIIHFDIPPQSLKSGLVEFGLQADVNIIVPAQLVTEQRASGVSGRYRLKRGLELLLNGTGLVLSIEDASKTAIITERAGDGLSTEVEMESIAAHVREVEDVIVVSARHKEESIIDVPISLSVKTEEDLDRDAIRDIVQLGPSLVNVSLSVVRATNSSLAAYIRGVGQVDPLVGFESGVGIYVDDVYLSRPQGAVLDIYDVERVEILRGPQGTLYGRNTVGGAVKYVTKALPNEAFTKVKAFTGSYGQKDLIVSGAIPLLDSSLKLGVSAGYLNREGFGKNLNTGEDNYNKEVVVGRLVAEYFPRDDVFLRVVGSRTVDDSNPRSGHRHILDEGEEPLSNVYDTYAGNSLGAHPVDDSQLIATDLSSFLDWNINQHYSLESITAYREDESQSPIDFDSLDEAILNSAVMYKNKQMTQEFRLKFEHDHFWGLVGLYYLEASAFNAYDTEIDGSVETGELNSALFTLGDLDVESEAIFFSLNFDVFSSLTMSLGARYTVDSRRVEIIQDEFEVPRTDTFVSPFFGGEVESIVTPIFDDNGNEVVPHFKGARRDTKFTPRLSVSWKPTDSLHLYSQYSTGFRSGSFDPRGDYSEEAVRSGFMPEFIETYELGLKTVSHQERVRASITLFYSDYSDIQIPGALMVDQNGDGVLDGFVGAVTNTASATIKGAEFEIFVNLQEGLYLDFGYGYMSAKFDTFLVGAGINIADYRFFSYAPETTTSLGLRAEMEVWGGEFSVGFLLNYQSAIHIFAAESTLDQSGYTLVDASVAWSSYDERWQLGLSGKNLSDKRYRIGGYNFPAAGVGTAFYGDPRTFSLSVSRRFE